MSCKQITDFKNFLNLFDSFIKKMLESSVLPTKHTFCTFLFSLFSLGLVYTMQEIDPRSLTERGLTNRIDQVTELFKCDWLYRMKNPSPE